VRRCTSLAPGAIYDIEGRPREQCELPSSHAGDHRCGGQGWTVGAPYSAPVAVPSPPIERLQIVLHVLTLGLYRPEWMD